MEGAHHAGPRGVPRPDAGHAESRCDQRVGTGAGRPAATVPGSDYGGWLLLDFPGGSGGDLVHIDWDKWFQTSRSSPWPATAARRRNQGVAAARTPYVAFSDDDSWWSAGALRQAADTFDRSPRLAVLAARTLVGAHEHTDPIGEAMERSPLRRGPSAAGPGVLGFLACSAVVRRSAFLEVGGFCELLVVGGEERLLAYDLAAAGWELAYLSCLTAHHHPATRDGGARGVLARRNDLLIDAMRRPWPVVLTTYAAAVRRSWSDPLERRALADALQVMPTALRMRRRVPFRRGGYQRAELGWIG